MRSHRQQIVVCGIALVLAGAATVGRAQAPQHAATAATYVSILEGASNFRDIGGYRTADARRVRKGLVYRSNQLSDLTARDYETLNRMGIKLLCDFRTDGERRRQPTEWQGGPAPEVMRARINKESDINMSPERVRELTSRATSASSLTTAYDGMIAPDAAAEYGNLYRRIAGGGVPLIAHCTAGKDRTGVFSAVLLTILGVPRQAVIEDYMLTGDYMMSPRGMVQARRDMQRALGLAEPPSDDTLRGIYTMHGDVMTRTFAAIDRQYGSFDAFVRDGLRLTPTETAALRSQLLE